MDVSLGIQQHIIGLEITMDDTLRMDIFQGTPQLSYPEPHCLLRETFARDMKPKIAAIHEIDHNVAGDELVTGLESWYDISRDVHILDILETVAQVAKERVVQMLEHSAFANNVPHTLRTYNWR
jgi:hypothetical protein